MSEAINYNIFIVLIVCLMFHYKCVPVRGEVYTVGEEQGWSSDTNFDSWSQPIQLHSWRYSWYEKEQHNVYEVTKAAYRSCDTSSGVIAKYESGKDEVKLSQEKKYWFLCNNIVGHCLSGMRFGIDVLKTTNSTPNGELNPPLPSSSSSTFHHFFHGWPFLIYLGIFTQF